MDCLKLLAGGPDVSLHPGVFIDWKTPRNYARHIGTRPCLTRTEKKPGRQLLPKTVNGARQAVNTDHQNTMRLNTRL